MPTPKTQRKTTSKQAAVANNICDNCKHGTWHDVQWNRSTIDGKPITLRCPFYHNGSIGIIRGTPACANFASR